MKEKTLDRDDFNVAQRFVCHIQPVITALKGITEKLEYDFADDDALAKITGFQSWLQAEIEEHQAVLAPEPRLSVDQSGDAISAAVARVDQLKIKISLHTAALEYLARIHSINHELLMHKGFSMFEIGGILPDESIQYTANFDARCALNLELEKLEQFVARGGQDFELLSCTSLAHLAPSSELVE